MKKEKTEKKFKATRTRYPGVYFIVGTSPTDGKPEKIYYVKFYRNGKRHFEKAGRSSIDGMTALGASNLRAAKMKGEELPNKERREVERAAKQAEVERWTVDKLWTEYQAANTGLKGIASYRSIFTKHLKPAFGAKEPRELVALDVDRLRIQLSKTNAAGTVRNVLERLRCIINFGVKKNLIPPIPFRIVLPRRVALCGSRFEDPGPRGRGAHPRTGRTPRWSRMRRTGGSLRYGATRTRSPAKRSERPPAG